MKVEIIKNTYAFGDHRKIGEDHNLTEEQGQKLINRGLAKEAKKAHSTKELKLDKETKNASN